MLKLKIKTVYSFLISPKRKIAIAENKTPRAPETSPGHNDRKPIRLLYHRDIKDRSHCDKITEAGHDWFMN